jgi:hypothetical protein
MRDTGGGALLRLVVHPVRAMLYLKRRESIRRRGPPIQVRSVIAETGDLTRAPGSPAKSHHWIGTDWLDVDNRARSAPLADSAHAQSPEDGR